MNIFQFHELQLSGAEKQIVRRLHAIVADQPNRELLLAVAQCLADDGLSFNPETGQLEYDRLPF